MTAWRVLFAAGKMFDYRLLVCPARFATDEQKRAFRRLISSLAEELTSSVVRRVLSDPNLPRITAFYVCRPATVNGTAVFDVSQRPVHVVGRRCLRRRLSYSRSLHTAGGGKADRT